MGAGRPILACHHYEKKKEKKIENDLRLQILIINDVKTDKIALEKKVLGLRPRPLSNPLNFL